MNGGAFEKVPNFCRKVAISDSRLNETNQCATILLIKLNKSTRCTNLKVRVSDKKTEVRRRWSVVVGVPLSVSGIGSFRNRTAAVWILEKA